MKLFPFLVPAAALLALTLIATSPAKADWAFDSITVSGYSPTGDIEGVVGGDAEGLISTHWVSDSGSEYYPNAGLGGSAGGTVSAKYVWRDRSGHGSNPAPSTASCVQGVGVFGGVSASSIFGSSGSASGANFASNALGLSKNGGKACASFNGEPDCFGIWGDVDGDTFFYTPSTSASSGVTSFTVSLSSSTSLSIQLSNAYDSYTSTEAYSFEFMNIAF